MAPGSLGNRTLLAVRAQDGGGESLRRRQSGKVNVAKATPLGEQESVEWGQSFSLDSLPPHPTPPPTHTLIFSY